MRNASTNGAIEERIVPDVVKRKRKRKPESPIVSVPQQRPEKRVKIMDSNHITTDHTCTTNLTDDNHPPPDEFHSILSLYYNPTTRHRLLKLKDYLPHILRGEIPLQKDALARRALRKSIGKLDKVVENAAPTDALKTLLENTLVAFRSDSSNDDRPPDGTFLRSSGGSYSRIMGNASIEEIVSFATTKLDTDRDAGGWEARKRRNVLLQGYGTGGAAWERLVNVVGDAIVWRLLVHTAVFIGVDEGGKGFVQICGVPFLEMVGPGEAEKQAATINRRMGAKRTPGEIAFVRTRLFCVPPSFTNGMEFKGGFNKHHVLNRLNKADNRAHVVHIMKYIFPWQFGLHNVFCSDVNKFKTTQPFMDYTYRPEIDSKAGAGNNGMKREVVPKRLRKVEGLVETMIRRSGKVKYGLLLRRHCPSKLLDEEATESQSTDGTSTFSLVEHSTPHSQVIRYVLSIVQHLMPLGFFGTLFNLRTILSAIGRFIHLRKFEAMTLHTFSQNVNIKKIKWLGPLTGKMSRTDTEKRKELLLEFLYWLMDSIVIPLIANTFYVTDISANTDKRLLYFRQDVWGQLMGSINMELKVSMFAALAINDLPYDKAASKIKKPKYLPPKSSIPYSTFRIVPKLGKGFRIITNMRRRATQPNGQLGPAPNMILKPILYILRYFRDKDKRFLMGSSMDSPSDFLPRVAEFKNRLKQKGLWKKEQLYFVKLDIRKCYDTIPTEKLLDYLREIFGLSKNAQEDGAAPVKAFRIQNYTKITPGGPTGCVKKFTSYAKPVGVQTSFTDDVKKLAKEREAMIAASNTASNTQQERPHTPQLRTRASKLPKRKRSVVYIGNAQKNGSKEVYQLETVYGILKEHLTQHIVKIGPKYYRQKKGIPQGSILSSLLVNMFYAKMEREELGFVAGQQKSEPPSFSERSTQDEAQGEAQDESQDKTHSTGESLLTRYVDDFLLVTTSLPTANNFLKTLLPGLPEYGATTHPEKALANFPNFHGIPVNPTQFFPYIGLDISTSDLSINVTHRSNLSTGTAQTVTTTARSKITLPTSHPLSLLPQKLVKSFAFKYLDARYTNTVLNDTKTIRRNIEEIWKDLARQVRAYVGALIPGYRKTTGAARFEDKRKVEKLLAEVLRGGVQVLRKKVKGDRAWVGWVGEKVLRRIVLGETGECKGRRKGKWTFRQRSVAKGSVPIDFSSDSSALISQLNPCLSQQTDFGSAILSSND